MSLYGPSDQAQHVSIYTPAGGAIPSGPFTVGVLFRNFAFNTSNIFHFYEASNFGFVSMYIDGNIWYDFASFTTNLDMNSPYWRWLIISKQGGNATPRVHYSDYVSTGAFTWGHVDMAGTKSDHSNCNRVSIGDEFSTGFRGELACLFGFTSLMDDASIEALFARSSADILNASPQFFAHWPEANGVQFVDIAGGGTEVPSTRLGTWSVSADPTNFDFSLPVTGRTGKPKVYDGAAWNPHQAKVWNGSTWVNHPVSGYDGTQFVVSK